MIFNVLSYVQRAWERRANAAALSDGTRRLTYEQLWRSVCALGSGIYGAIGAGRRPVVVCIEHTVTDILCFFGAVYSGNFYVPIDMSMPPERLEKMLQTMQPGLILSERPEKVRAIAGDFTVLSPEALMAAPPLLEAPWEKSKDTDILYVIFTSGSTGEPKGAGITHRAVIDLVEQLSDTLNIKDGSVFGNQAPFDFDGSVKDIYLAMKTAGTMEILEKRLFSFPKLLLERLNERRVSVLIWSVSAMKILSSLGAFEKQVPRYVEKVMFSGEVMPIKTLIYWKNAMPDVQFVNLYGPTEIACNCTYHIVTDADIKAQVLPIGKPLPNCSVFLLEGDTPVEADGEIGEICVAGSCLSVGYYNRPELTAAAFTKNPLQTAYDERIYRTGDLGYWRSGKLYFAGRRDTQIKRMGYRVELTEIELCANGAEGVELSACIADEKQRLVLYYTGSAAPQRLRECLREKLPRYMLPAKVIQLERFPENRTGKLDKKALRAMGEEERDGQAH